MAHTTPSHSSVQLPQSPYTSHTNPPHSTSYTYTPHSQASRLQAQTQHSSTSRSPYIRSPSYSRAPSFTRSPSYSRAPSFTRSSSHGYRPVYRRSASSRSYRQASAQQPSHRPAFQRTASTQRSKVTFPFKSLRAKSFRRNSKLNLHELLEYHQGGFASLEYDLSLDVSHILICHGSEQGGYSRLTPDHLSAQATTPALSRLYISCKWLLWTIEIPPATNSRYVTLGDVLEGIYRALRVQASDRDWHMLDNEGQRRVRNSWKRRYKRQASEEERLYEERHGLRRVDFLGKNLGFFGLTPGNSAEHWIMHVKPVNKHVKFKANS